MVLYLRQAKRGEYMNRNLIIGLVAAVVVGGGIWAYLANQDDEATSNDTNQSQQDGENPAFNATSTADLDFVGTISGSGQEGTIVFEYDKDTDSIRYIATSADGSEIQTITTPDAYYAQANGQWIKYPTGTDSGFNPDNYQYTADELATYQGSAYQGTQDCASGTCHVWRYNAGNTESTLLIDTSTGYIVRVSSVVGDQTSAIDYEYKEVSITAPADAQEIELPS